MASDQAPLIAGRIHGIRQWSVGWKAGDAELRGFGGAKWAAGGTPTKARCRRERGRGRAAHRAPRPECSCGLYAVHPWEGPVSLYGGGGGGPLEQIHGVVEAWGRVELHATGFRAQYARPVALALVGVPRRSDAGTAAALLAARYQAELIEVADPGELREHCRERGWGLSREVVGSLVPDEPPAPTRLPAPAGAPPRPPQSQSRWERVGEIAGMAFAAVLAIAFWGFLAFLVVAIAIRAISGDFDTDDPFRSQKLRVLDQALIRRSGELHHIAIVRNTSDKRMAMAVFATGRVLDREGARVARLEGRGAVDRRPTLLPGETGVVVDSLPTEHGRSSLDGVRFQTTLSARREAAPDLAPPVRLGPPALDRAECSLRIPVRARSSAHSAGITIVANDRHGEISTVGTVRLGREAISEGRKELSFEDPGRCPGWLHGVRTYPFLFPGTIANADRAGA